MRYLINLKEGKIPEISIYADNYHNQKLFVFINDKDGSFLMDLERGKSRLDLIDKETANTFDISADEFVVLDLIDALTMVANDTKALVNRYKISKEETQ